MAQTATDPVDVKDPNDVAPELMKDVQSALKVAKISMMMAKNTTFYTTILFSLKQFINYEVPTAATDGKHLWINPDYFKERDPNKRITLLAHEVLHVAFDHMHRCGNRIPELWNIAGDYVINGHLKKAGYQLEPTWLYDAKYVGWTTEAVYDELYKKAKDEIQQLIDKFKKDGLGDVKRPADCPPDQQVPQDDVTDLVMRASVAAQHADGDPGTIPGEVGINIQKVINPPLPWNVIMSHLLCEFVKDDYTFRRPNRRYLPQYLPTAHSEALTHIAIAVDASCSVTDHEFNVQVGKICEIMDQVRPKKITVISFDTEIKDVQELTEGDNPLKRLKFHGRGGTQIAPVHQWVADNKPTAICIFSDGEFRQHEPIAKHIPIIWVIYNDPKWKSKHGRVIHYDID